MDLQTVKKVNLPWNLSKGDWGGKPISRYVCRCILTYTRSMAVKIYTWKAGSPKAFKSSFSTIQHLFSSCWCVFFWCHTTYTQVLILSTMKEKKAISHLLYELTLISHIMPPYRQGAGRSYRPPYQFLDKRETSVFLTNAKSRFAPAVLDGLVGPSRLAHLDVSLDSLEFLMQHPRRVEGP